MIVDPQIVYLLKSINNRLCCTTGGGTTTPTEITFAPSTAQDGFGRLRVSEPFTLFDSSHRYDDNDLWATDEEGGDVLFNSNAGLVELTLNTAGDLTRPVFILRETIKVFAYQPGKSLLVLNTFVMNPPVEGVR